MQADHMQAFATVISIVAPVFSAAALAVGLMVKSQIATLTARLEEARRIDQKDNREWANENFVRVSTFEERRHTIDQEFDDVRGRLDRCAYCDGRAKE